MILDDLTKWGKCRLTVARGTFLPGFLSWGMPKGAPRNDNINKAYVQQAYTSIVLWVQLLKPSH